MGTVGIYKMPIGSSTFSKLTLGLAAGFHFFGIATRLDNPGFRRSYATIIG